MRKTTVRKGIFHTITILLIIVSVCFSVCRFPAVFTRFLSAGEDLLTSIAYYTLFMYEKEYLVTATIGILPENIETILPITLEEFERLMYVWGVILQDELYLEEYFAKVAEIALNVSKTIVSLTLPTLALVAVLILVYSENDKKHNQDSVFLRFWRCVWYWTGGKVVFYVRKYVRFLTVYELKGWEETARKWYKRILFALWFYNLSGLNIVMESVAWLLYWSVSWDIPATLVWIAKVVADFTVPVFFLPTWLLVIIGYKLFDKFRVWIAKGNVKGGIEKVKKFLTSILGAKFINGKQRSGKTSLLTQLKTISESCVMRPQAKKGFLNRMKQFPTFPWVLYARFIMDARKTKKITKWSRLVEFLSFLQYVDRNYANADETLQKWYRRRLRKDWGYEFDDFCFGWAKNKQEVFNDGLKLVGIYEALEGFGKQYMLYSQPNPLDASNYPIRSDFEIIDEGNIVEFKNNLVELNTRESYKRTKWSHRLNWDMFRFNQFDKENEENNSFEYGIRVSMEHAKERKNQLTRRTSDKEDGRPTQDNDLVETDTKIRTHLATCDNYTYEEDLYDDQRASSLGADNVELMTKIYIREKKPIKFYIPFFAIDEAIYLLASSIFDSILWFIIKKKGSNTALIALLWKLYIPILGHYTRYKNLFSYYPLELKISDGSDGAILSEAKSLPLISIVAYRGRYRTDSLSAFYYRKMRGSMLGLNEVPMYKGETMSMDEMVGQNSYMIKDLTKAFKGTTGKRAKKKK